MKHDSFQRFLTLSGPEVQPLSAQAQLGEVVPPSRSQFSYLLRHFLARFFNHDAASHDGDAKTRLVQIAFAAGMPPLLVAVFLWPVYHPFPNWPPGSTRIGPPPYWNQASHHFFFVVYSFTVVGIATLFEWDLFFPDLTDLFVLTTMPISARKLFSARVGAIAILVSAFLADTTCLTPLILPLSTDPPNLWRFVAAHVTAVLAAGLFSAVFVLTLQSVVLAVFGERIFRRIALLAQGCMITALTLLLLFFPMLSGISPQLLQSGNRGVLFFPPFWFLGMYQQILDGHAAWPVWSTLTSCGVAALLASLAILAAAYPLAYVRRTGQVLLGTPLTSSNRLFADSVLWLQQITIVRSPVGRAVSQFTGQTLFRVSRYRIYLVLYGGVGLALVTAIVLRLQITQQRISFRVDGTGLRLAIGLVAFWTIAGLRTSFMSAGNRQGYWIWRVNGGDPPSLEHMKQAATAMQRWVIFSALGMTCCALVLLLLYAPQGLRTPLSCTAQFTVATGLCVLLVDILFLRSDTIPFTGGSSESEDNLALTLLGYFTLVPAVMTCSLVSEQWMETDVRKLGIGAVLILIAHLWLRKLKFDSLRIASLCSTPDEDDKSITTLGSYL